MPPARRKEPTAVFRQITDMIERIDRRELQEQAAQEVCRALAGMYQHGSDYKKGTHAQIVRRAFEKWEELAQ